MNPRRLGSWSGVQTKELLELLVSDAPIGAPHRKIFTQVLAICTILYSLPQSCKHSHNYTVKKYQMGAASGFM